MPTSIDPQALTAAIGRLRAVRLRVRARARDEIRLGSFPGSALRGGLLAALLDVGCITTHRECAQCAFLAECAIPRITGEGFAVDAPGFHAKPYRIVTGAGEPGEPGTLEFGVDLFGAAADRAAIVVAAIARLGERGLGRKRGRFDVLAIERADAAAIADDRAAWRPLEIHAALARRAGELAGESLESVAEFGRAPSPSKKRRCEEGGGGISVEDMTTTRDEASGASQPGECRPNSATLSLLLRFEAPLRIHENGRLLGVFSFPAFASSLLRRASGLLESSQGIRLDVDGRALAERASRVTVVSSRLEKRDQVRFSKRQDRSMNLHGFTGEVELAGDLAVFAPLIAFGEIAGAGKGTTFGQGSVLATSLAGVNG